MKLRTIILISTFTFVNFFSHVFSHEVAVLTGDLIFTSPDFNAENSDFSVAINTVTSSDAKTNFTHVGIVEVIGDSVWVIHASPEKGVVRECLSEFLIGAKVASIYRLKSDLHIIPSVIKNAKSYLGQDYDFAFLLNEKTQYCSGLIYNIFRQHNIFELKPMTFKNPETKEFDEFWVQYYIDLGIEIPEGVLGCNPNDMSKSKNIYFVKEIEIH